MLLVHKCDFCADQASLTHHGHQLSTLMLRALGYSPFASSNMLVFWAQISPVYWLVHRLETADAYATPPLTPLYSYI